MPNTSPLDTHVGGLLTTGRTAAAGSTVTAGHDLGYRAYAPVPIAERPWWREAIDEPDPVGSIQFYARTMCRISGQADLVLRALETAASVDHDAAEVWTRFQHQRRVGLNKFAVTLTQKTHGLRYDQDTITDTMWALASDAYLRHLRDAGWPVEGFQAWPADLLQRTFLK